MKTKLSTSGLLRLLLVTCLVAVVACGSDDDSDTSIIVNPDGGGGTERQEEQGPVDTQPTVVVNNNIDQNVRVINRQTRVEDDDWVMDWQCDNVDPVVHKQYIHVSVNCPTIINNDLNNDGVLDQTEVEQAIGPAVMALDSDIASRGEETFPTGSSYQYTQRVPLSELREVVPQGEDFVVMYYGVDESRPIPSTVEATGNGPVNINIPIACKVFNAPRIEDGDSTTTTTTTGGGNGGTTGGTNGGTTGGTTGGTDGDTTTTTTTGGAGL